MRAGEVGGGRVCRGGGVKGNGKEGRRRRRGGEGRGGAEGKMRVTLEEPMRRRDNEGAKGARLLKEGERGRGGERVQLCVCVCVCVCVCMCEWAFICA